MKTIKQLLVLTAFAFTLLFVSCSKDESASSSTTTPSYSFSCKIDGVLNKFEKIQVSRATINNIETFIILANKSTTGADTATKFTITLKKSVAGWATGINFWIDAIEEFGTVNYLTSGGLLYNTKNLTGSQKVIVLLSSVSYKKDGIIKGTFYGSINNKDKVLLTLTEGEFYCNVQN